MRAAAIDRFGPPSALKMHTLDAPVPGPAEVLIAMHTAGVGTWDAGMRSGDWSSARRPRFPLILGVDGAGIVVARGRRVRRLRVGDRVYAYSFENPKGGFYAEYVAVDASKAARVPRSLDLLHAGAAAVTALTALQGIDSALRVRAGDTVLVFGASGTVGTLAVQFAKLRGARVIGTASGRAASRLVKRLGADAVVDGRAKDVMEQLLRHAPDGITAVLALAGGPQLEACLRLVKGGGRVAFPNGVEPVPRRRKAVRMRGYDAEPDPREFARLGKAITAARLRVPIAAKYRLAAAAQAHRRMERGRVVGRMVLRVR